MTDSPPGVELALWAEFQRLSDQVHELAQQRGDAEGTEGVTAPPSLRIVIDLPEEQALFFAWLDARKRQRKRGENGPTKLTPELIRSHERIMRRNVRAYLAWLINEDFHGELHMLATGASDLLRPMPPKPPKPERSQESGWDSPRGSGDLDDDIPF